MFLNKLESNTTQVAIINKNKSYTYFDLLQRIKYYKSFLQDNHITSGDVVVLLSDYSFESISFFLALSDNLNIIVPITSKNLKERNDKIEVSECNHIIEIDGNDIASLVKNNNVKNNKSILIDNLVKNSFAGLILFSSGSTGKPKAMLHNLTNLLNSYLDRKQRKNIFLVFLMFDHIGGINTLLNCLSIGSVIVIPDSRKPTEIAEIIEKYKIEVLPASPTFLNLLLISKSTDQYDFSSLKIITYGTESMPEKLLTDLKNIFPKVRLMQTFGTSETGIIKTHSKSSTSLLLKFDDPNQEFKIINGELFIRSKTQILGYLNYQSESFTSDGWFKTGDLVEMDKDGFVKITGRINDIINVGGEKVFPIEIENIILELPYVSDCLVYGEKNAITGYSVCVDIKLNKEFSIKNEKLLIRNHCKSSLDKYKIPTKINIVMDILFNERFKKIRIK